MIAFEIVSPSNTAAHLDRKIQEYLTGGALEVWIIYPDPRHAWVYVPDAVARREDRGFRSTLLPGVEIPFEAFL
jgi:Uma2 family endonuclease